MQATGYAGGLDFSGEVQQDNCRAIGLYQKFGFQTAGIFPALVEVGESYVNFRRMAPTNERIWNYV